LPGTIKFIVNQKMNTNMGSLLHGYIMETIDPSYANVIHEKNLNPYTQCIYYSKEDNGYIWKITSLDGESHDKIILRIKDKIHKGFYLKAKEQHYDIREIKKECYKEYRDIVLSAYSQEAEFPSIRFLTPTSFKSQGEHVFFPTTRFIFQSIINKLSSFSDEIDFDDKTLLKNIEDSCRIIRYDLKSTKFYLEKVRIDSFVGNVFIRASGPDAFRSLIKTILSMSSYTGIGIKTSIGMGGVEIE
jgi:CRISPR-associated endoribonuclease Cas6